MNSELNPGPTAYWPTALLLSYPSTPPSCTKTHW